MRTSYPRCITNYTGLTPTFNCAESNDPEFDDYARRFASIETAAEKLLKDTKAFTEAVGNLFNSGYGFAQHFSTVFHPVAGETDLASKHPEAEHTVRHVDEYEGALDELKAAVVPELELIESRIIGPVKELQSILKLIRKSITKREHKVGYRLYEQCIIAHMTFSSLITIASTTPSLSSGIRRKSRSMTRSTCSR